MNQITIGDHEFNIRIKMGVFETILEMSGKEIVPFLQDAINNIPNSTFILLVAAVDCYNEKYGKPPADRDYLRKAIKTDGELKHLNELIGLYSEFLNPAEPGEAPAPEAKKKKIPASH